jgi:DUF4097 and DUF4098 domain-containing protein YvlB
VKCEFATPEPPKIRVALGSGTVEIETEETDKTVVEVEARRGDPEDLKVEQHGRDIVIETRKRIGFLRDHEFSVRISAPHGSNLDCNIASADLTASGRFWKADVNSASGDVEIEQVEQGAKVRSASGDVVLGRVGGKTDVNTASGDVEVGMAGDGVSVRSASGRVRIGEATGQVSVNTASGDQLIDAVAEGGVDLKSASGDVQIGVRKGSRLHVDARSLSGKTTSEVDLDGVETETEGPLVELKAATMSGDIRVVRA